MGNIASFEYRIVKYKETNKIGLPIEERRHSNNFTNTAIKQSIIITTSYPGSLPSPGAAPCVDKDLACEVVIIINKGVSPSSVYIDGICSSLRPSLVQHWINYTLHFVDLTDFYTQIIESYWNRCETKIKAMEGIQRDMLPGYLNEFM